MVFSRSEYIAFSDIPPKIYQVRLNRLANLATQYNRIAIQTIVDEEIAELKAQAQQVAELKARLERLEAGAVHAAAVTH